MYRRIRIARYLQKPVYRDHLFGDCARRGTGGSATPEEKYTEIYEKSSANEFMARQRPFDNVALYIANNGRRPRTSREVRFPPPMVI